jgi:hypothetical protein
MIIILIILSRSAPPAGYTVLTRNAILKPTDSITKDYLLTVSFLFLIHVLSVLIMLLHYLSSRDYHLTTRSSMSISQFPHSVLY